MKWFSDNAQVAALLITGCVVLGGAVWVLGDMSFAETYPVYVDFDNPGILQVGAAVRAGGIEIGQVEAIDYRGGRLDPLTQRRPIVRLRLAMHRETRVSVHQDAQFTPTTQGVLGDRFIAVDPGNPELPPLEAGTIVVGNDAPRLDVALAHGFELLEMATDGMRDNRDELRSAFDDIVALDSALVSLRGRSDDFERIAENAGTLGDEAEATGRAARHAYVDGERARRLRRNIDVIQESFDGHLPMITEHGERLGEQVDDLSDTYGPEQQRQVDAIADSVPRITERAETAADEAEHIANHIEEGRGTLGLLRMDDEINDDVLGIYRQLIHNPWRFFWRD